MRIKAQDGEIYTAYNVEINGNGCLIKCKNMKDKRKKHILGKYESFKRESEVSAEIVAVKTGYYEMPEN